MNKIVFFGTGPVASKSLKLLNEFFKIEAVITKPKPKHHKGDFPVIDVCDELNLPIFYVKDRLSLDDLFTTETFSSQIAILIDFGIIVSQKVIDYFPLGIVNSHFSLLPELRGADPITFAILSGQRMTGVSLMLIAKKMDEGPLLAQSPFEINEAMTTPELTDELIELSYAMLRDVIPLYIREDVILFDQGEDNVFGKSPTYSRRLIKADSKLDFSKSAEELAREVRAFNGWPGSKTRIFDVEVTITEAHAVPSNSKSKPGTTDVNENKSLAIHTNDGDFVIDRLKPAGKKEMDATSFLAGYNK
ncbi:MAG: methionyl-tRNA formyltransferase [bacterium]|nr:methionyl-tRNA formyltransferase [bacterium]